MTLTIDLTSPLALYFLLRMLPPYWDYIQPNNCSTLISKGHFHFKWKIFVRLAIFHGWYALVN